MKERFMNEKLFNTVRKVCIKFNKKYKDKYIAHYFLDYKSFIILIYNLNKTIFYKAIVTKEITQQKLLKHIESIILGSDEE